MLARMHPILARSAQSPQFNAGKLLKKKLLNTACHTMGRHSAFQFTNEKDS
jgi:hypothetical protein